MGKLKASTILLAAIASMPLITRAATDKEVAACAAIAQSQERLICYDKAAQPDKPLPAPTTASGEANGKWQKINQIDPLTDQYIVGAVLIADSADSRNGEPVKLYVRCQAKITQMFVTWPDYLDGNPVVTHRVGRREPVTQQWNVSTNNLSSFYPSSPFVVLNQIIADKQFVVSTMSYYGSQVTAVFDVSYAGNALADARKACYW